MSQDKVFKLRSYIEIYEQMGGFGQVFKNPYKVDVQMGKKGVENGRKCKNFGHPPPFYSTVFHFLPLFT